MKCKQDAKATHNSMFKGQANQECLVAKQVKPLAGSNGEVDNKSCLLANLSTAWFANS